MGKQLRDELSNDPLGRGYADMTDLEVAQDLMSERLTIRKRVQVPRLGQFLMEEDLWEIIREATGSSTEAEAKAAENVRDAAMAPPAEVDLDSEGLSTALDTLVSEGTITASQRDSIDALADYNVSRAGQLGLGTVREGDVSRARGE